MQLSISVLATVSGKSVIFHVDSTEYAFNVFEGFQRYCMEKTIRMMPISAIFLSSPLNIPALIGVYLTLGDSGKKELEVISDFDPSLFGFNLFKYRPGLNVIFSRTYADSFMRVTIKSINQKANFLIRMNNLPGRLLVDKIPDIIPREYYKCLQKGTCIEINGKIFNGQDYCGQYIKLGTILIIFSEESMSELDDFIESADIIIVTTSQGLSYLTGLHLKKKVFFINDNHLVEFTDWYLKQQQINELDKNRLLPSSYECQIAGISSTITNETGNFTILESCDKFEFSRENGFKVIRAKQIEMVRNSNKLPKNYLLFLGTGCAIPSKHRNVSSILYKNGNDVGLLDCGEDTLGQIKRVYGNLEILKNLKFIYLSHSHADHILGIIGILDCLDHPIWIVGPSGCRKFIASFYRIHTFIETDICKELEIKYYSQNKNYSQLEYKCLNNRKNKYSERECASKSNGYSITLDDFTMNLKIDSFNFVLCGCMHHIDSTSVSISHLGFSFSYSGDSSPSTLFSKISNNVDIMIHEATFHSDQKKQAEKTNHSTTSEAVDIFALSGAKRLIMTHFSQRNIDLTPEECNASDLYIIDI